MSAGLDYFIKKGGTITLKNEPANGSYQYAAVCTLDGRYLSSHYNKSVAMVLGMVEAYFAELAVSSLRRDWEENPI